MHTRVRTRDFLGHYCTAFQQRNFGVVSAARHEGDAAQATNPLRKPLQEFGHLTHAAIPHPRPYPPIVQGLRVEKRELLRHSSAPCIDEAGWKDSIVDGRAPGRFAVLTPAHDDRRRLAPLAGTQQLGAQDFH